MSLDYTGSNTGVFSRAGKVIKYVNAHLADATTTLPAEVSAIMSLYESAGATTNGLYVAQVGDLPDVYDSFKSFDVGIRQTLASYVDRALLDNDTVISQLPGPPNADVNSVLPALWQRMVLDGKTVNRSTVTLGSVTAVSGNQGNGTVLLTKVLDGYNPPLVGSVPNLAYNGVNSELAATADTMTFACIADSMRDGLSEGAEQFSWTGSLFYGQLDYRAQGSGPGPGVAVADAGSNLIVDGNFENWSSNSPTSWTLLAGTVAGTQILQGATVWRGSASLKLVGDGATATIGVTQAVSPSTLNSRRRYLVACRIEGGSVPAAGSILINFTGTGYAKTAPTDEVQTLQISGTPTGGTYKVSYTGPYGGTQQTAGIAFNANAATVQAALRLLAGLECVVVTTNTGAPPNVTWNITFYGQPGKQNALTVDVSSLTGGSPAQAVARTTTGVEGDCIVIPAAGFPTTWHLAYFWINTAAVIPDNWTLSVACGSTLTNAQVVYFDSLVFAAAVYHGGVGAVAVAGSSRWCAGDSLTVTVANDGAGVFQEFFRQWYGFQLPSSGSPNISDSLAT